VALIPKSRTTTKKRRLVSSSLDEGKGERTPMLQGARIPATPSSLLVERGGVFTKVHICRTLKALPSTSSDDRAKTIRHPGTTGTFPGNMIQLFRVEIY